MSMDHVVAGISSAIGGAGMQFFVNRKLRAFLQGHLENIYRRLGRVEAKLDLTPVPMPETDPGSTLANVLPFDKTNPGRKP